MNRAERRARTYVYQECRNSITGYDRVHVTGSHTRLQRKAATYALLPVWYFGYTYKGKQDVFAINGQTGKIVGKLPISKGKAAAWFGGIFAGISTVLFVIGGLLG